MEDNLLKSVTAIKGIGSHRAEALENLNIRTLRDIFDYYPRAYLDMKNLTPIANLRDGETAAVKARLETGVLEKKTGLGGKLTLYSFVVSDGDEEMSLTLFNQKFTAQKLEEGKEYIFFGKAEVIGFHKTIKNPIIEPADGAEIKPVYPLTAGVSQNLLRNSIKIALDGYIDSVSETLPEEIVSEFSLMSIKEAYKSIHFPQSTEDAEKARKRFITEELLYLILGMNILKKKNRKRTSMPLDKPVDMKVFTDSLPFSLTNAQKRVISECLNDMKKPFAMARLLQGDVGSGKTAVAAALMFYTSMCCGQSALMAPTEVLAIQHYENLKELFGKLNIKTALLTGSTKAAERKKTLEELKSGEISILIGTHALITKDVEFSRLSLVIADEQHRFGVNQRSALTEKGENPHVLIMSATPIPRTMALILYGDLDVSIIDELPAGRQKISSFVVGSDKHEKMYGYLREQVLAGNQAYVVCPNVEDSENDAEIRSVIGFSEELAEKYLAGINVAYLHGKMAPKEKESVMKRFAEGEIKVLVATTVIEVGINVPNATVMIVENAERFGLSQLHQLRGRVGRGTKKSWCFLVTDFKGTVLERLENFCKTTDGYEISKQDLELRGPGDIFGSKQHGLPELKLASLTDMETLSQAQQIAVKITETKSWYTKPENAKIAEAVVRMFGKTTVV